MIYKNIPDRVHQEYVECTGGTDTMYKQFIDNLTPLQIKSLSSNPIYIYDLLMEHTINQLCTAIDTIHKQLP